MIFLICLILAGILAFTGNQRIHKHANALYLLSTAISGLVVLGTALQLPNALPTWLRDSLWFAFAYGSFATAIFVLVMFAGAVPRGSIMQKKLIPIRKELSIIASILTLGHNLSAGQIYFVWLFTKPERMQGTILWATLCSLVLILIMLPLFITSFTVIRKKMKPATWKNLQKLSYPFYGLIYIHVLLLFVPKAQAGRNGALFNIIVFSIVFLAYAALRLRKALDKKDALLKNIPIAISFALCIAVAYFSMPSAAVEEMPMMEAKVEEVAEKQVEKQDPTNVQGKTEETTVDSKVAEQTQADEVKKEEKSEASDTKEAPVAEETKAEESTLEKTQEAKSADKADTKNAPSKADETPKEKADDSKKSTDSKAETTTVVKEESKADPIAEPQKEANASKEEPKPTVEAPKEETPKAEAPATQSAETPAVPAPKKEPAPTPTPVFKYKSGTFNGSADGYNGPVTVSVTIKDDVITAINILSHTDDEPFWTSAKAITGSILSAQSTGVSTISGATFSSKGIKEAVEAALNKAKN